LRDLNDTTVDLADQELLAYEKKLAFDTDKVILDDENEALSEAEVQSPRDICLQENSRSHDSWAKDKPCTATGSGWDTTDTSSKKRSTSNDESSMNVSLEKIKPSEDCCSDISLSDISPPPSSKDLRPQNPAFTSPSSHEYKQDVFLTEIFQNDSDNIYQLDYERTNQVKYACYDNFINRMHLEEYSLSHSEPEIQEEPERESNKPLILNHSLRRYIGNLKFFDDNRGFGFVTIDGENNGKDLFIHHDDLLKANIDLRKVKKEAVEGVVKMSFCCLDYMGKYNRSRKAVELKIVEAY
jgi:cold shock CspA family protein